MAKFVSCCAEIPGPRIRCGAWLQEVCAARSLGKRVFRDKIKFATKERKLHYFGKFMEFMTLPRGLWADCENMLLQAPRDSSGPWGQKKVQNPASLVKGSDSEHSRIKLSQCQS